MLHYPFVTKCDAFDDLASRFDAHAPVQLDGRLAAAIGDGCNALRKAVGAVLHIDDIEDMTTDKATEIAIKCSSMEHTLPRVLGYPWFTADNNPLVHPAPVREVLWHLDEISRAAIETQHWFLLLEESPARFFWLHWTPTAYVGSVTMRPRFLHYLTPRNHILVEHDGLGSPSSIPFAQPDDNNNEIAEHIAAARRRRTTRVHVFADDVAVVDDST